MHGIKVLMAKNYIDNLSEEVSKGLREKAEQGMWPSYSPLGYRNVVTDDGRHGIEPDPERAPFVKQLFEWYATGDHSLKEVSRLARQSYADAGIELLDLASGAHDAFKSQASEERRKLLQMVVSNSSWKHGRLAVELQKPFDLILKEATKAREGGRRGPSEGGQKAPF